MSNHKATKIFPELNRIIRNILFFEDYRIFNLLIYLLEKSASDQSPIQISQEEMSQENNCDVKTLREALKVLQKKRIIYIDKHIGFANSFRFNESLVFSNLELEKNKIPNQIKKPKDKGSSKVNILDKKEASLKEKCKMYKFLNGLLSKSKIKQSI
jgi:hypothetical protein